MTEKLELDTIGPEVNELPPSSECSTLLLEDDEYITTLEIGYTNTYIESVGVITSKSNNKMWGVVGT